jgi:hypothetical protein
MHIQAPIAKTTLPKALGGNALIFPKVRAVDIYVTVDGQAKTDGHICCGDVSLDRAGAIDHAFKKCDADKQMLTDGPASGGKPWATIVSEEFKDISFIHLPLVFSGSVDDCALPESESYAGPLLSKFGALLSEVGAGKHEWQARHRSPEPPPAQAPMHLPPHTRNPTSHCPPADPTCAPRRHQWPRRDAHPRRLQGWRQRRHRRRA